MAFESLKVAITAMKDVGVIRLFAKALAENDNSKQQIYLGKSFEILNQLPFDELSEVSQGTVPTVRASLNFLWLTDRASISPAPHAKLILYPEYPEVRLSGFLKGSSNAPSNFLQPIDKGSRKHNNGPDGRFLLLGVTGSRQVVALLSPAGSPISKEIVAKIESGTIKANGVFWELAVPGGTASALDELLSLLTDIRKSNPHSGQKLSKNGLQPYEARNAGGVTLEALLGIEANSKSAPDFKGWEIKAFGKSPITLMTPEPNGGTYAEIGLEAFLNTYGYTKDGRLNFTGRHKAGLVQNRSKLKFDIEGFDAELGKITDAKGRLALIDRSGECAASWSFTGLINHWGRKHNKALYVPYTTFSSKYSYNSPALVGEGTDFTLFLDALSSQLAYYDPGLWFRVLPVREQKKRNQFRVSKLRLKSLYRSLREESF